LSAAAAADAPSKARALTPYATIVSDENGIWAGPSMGTTHQNGPAYQARKRISTACVAAEAWQRVREARVRIFFFIQDISHWGPTPNGLDESFEVVVNGRAHAFRTSDGFPAKAGRTGKLRWEWTDFVVPVDELIHGDNEIVVRKLPAPGAKNDDYIYVGIDSSVVHGHSFMSEDGGATWQSAKLNLIDATGEYMVRLVLIGEPGMSSTVQCPGLAPPPADAHSVLAYADWDEDGQRHVLGLAPSAFARRRDVLARVEYAGGAPVLEWLDEDGRRVEAESRVGGAAVTSSARIGYVRPAKLIIAAQASGLAPNPGFEAAAGNRPATWLVREARGEHAAVTVDRTVAHSGKRSLRFRHANAVYSWVKAYIPVKPRSRYTAGVWVKTDGVKPAARLDVGNLGTHGA